MLKRILLALVFAGCFGHVNSVMGSAAQTGAEEGLESLMYMDIPINIASRIEKPIYKAPGIVSVITREEIMNSGARDLDDLLYFIPGFIPAMDIFNIKGYGVRGMWSMEGKLLILMDGVQMNETLYGSTVFAGQFFTDNIERIEIIRGPGSALYGAYGELAVINIITRDSTMHGSSVSATYGHTSGTNSREIASFCYGNRFKDLGISFKGTVGDSLLGEGNFTDYYNQVFPMEKFSNNKFWSANLGIDYKKFSIRFLGNSLCQDSQLHGYYNSNNDFFPAPSKAIHEKFISYNIDAKYTWHFSDALTLTPKITYTESNDWQLDEKWAREWGNRYYKVYPTSQIRTNLSAAYAFTPDMSLVVGGEYLHDYLTSEPPSQTEKDLYYYSFLNDELKVDNSTCSFFAEYNVQTVIADVTAGMRYDKNSEFCGVLVPRLAVTREIGDFHIKGMASRAYHAPTLKQLHYYSADIKPEYVNDYEMEFGYKLNQEMLVLLNIFYMKMSDTIVYTGLYENSDVNTSRGIEAEYRLFKEWGNLSLTYSYYYAKSNFPDYLAQEQEGDTVNGVMLGFPTHKVTLKAGINIAKGLSVNPGLIYLSERYNRYDATDEITGLNQEMDTLYLMNLYIRKVFSNNSWEIGLGIFNVFDTDYAIAPGYYTYNRPVPCLSREYVLKAVYNF
jgi:outer membrane cobalamin receptor